MVEEREDKVNNANAYTQLITGQNKSPANYHFDGCMQWDIDKFFSEDIREKHSVIQKGISNYANFLQQ